LHHETKKIDTLGPGKPGILAVAEEEEERERERRRRQGQKRHLTVVLSPHTPEMIILMCLVSSNKFGNNKSVHQQIAPFSMSISIRRSLSVSTSKFCQLIINYCKIFANL
jgi:hypothetical protein